MPLDSARPIRRGRRLSPWPWSPGAPGCKRSAPHGPGLVLFELDLADRQIEALTDVLEEFLLRH
jgi:hypothetical protein